MLRRILLAIVLFLGAFALEAQSFVAAVSQNPVEKGNRFTLNFILENTSGQITPPPLGEFVVVFGPSQSNNFSNYNGKVSRTTTISYVLIAKDAGKYTIAPAKAETKDGVLKTEPIILEVVEGNNNNSGQQQSSNSNNRTVDNAGNIIMEIKSTKNSVYVGEPMVISYTLYSRYSQLELGETTYPPITGFWVENLDMGSVQWDPNYATINGMRYRKAVVKKQLVYPQQAGELTIPSFTQNVIVNRSFFNPGSKVSAESNSLKITVKPFPSGAPADFSNSSGLYRISSEISTQTCNVNDAITFKVRLSGKGNLKLVNTPAIEFPGDFEVYEPKTNDKIAATENGISGYREWEYIVIPRYPGTYEIPKVTFSYFDQASKQYKRISTEAKSIKVEGSALSNNGGVVVNPKTDVTLLNKDIRYIDTNWEQNLAKTNFSAKSTLYWLLVGLIIVLCLGLSFYVRKQQSLRENTVVYKQKKASRFAEKKLSKAKSYLSKNDAPNFYVAVVDAVHGFIQDRFNLDKTKLSRDILKVNLTEKGASEGQVKELQDLIDDCDMARYAPSASVNMNDTYERAKKALQWLEKLSA